jgi:PIN domain nuclease of toxin-antitoxin system
VSVVLLDTQAFVWWVVQPDRLSAAAKQAIRDAEAAFVSAVSVYEIDIKRDRDGMLARMPDDLVASLGTIGFQWRDVTPTAAQRAARLPWLHRDPWDRLIIAQAQELGAAVVSVDRQFAHYAVDVIW